MMRVTFYTRADCGLCDEARQELEALRPDIPHKLVEVDVDREPTLVEKYGDHVPVVKVGAYTLQAPFGMQDLKVTLMAARDGFQSQESTAGVDPSVGRRLNRALRFFAVHWLAIFNLGVFIYVGLPFAAPALMKSGATRPAQWIYRAYSPLCHQLAFRSWFLFGDQIAYPRELAGTSLTTYGAATGLDEDDLWGARAFVGNEQVGYKVALCERDIGIYAAILLAGLAFGLVRHRLKPVPLWVWFLVGILPIALDGGTQLLSGFPLPFISFTPRESTPLLRTLTGGLFGVMNVWLAYPYLEETMAETRALVSAKLAAADEPTTRDSSTAAG